MRRRGRCRRPARRSCPARRRRRARDRRRPGGPRPADCPRPSSSRAATRRTAMSNSAICASKMSRNRPEMRSVTSMRGRSSTASGRISMPVTRLEALSQTGCTPRYAQRLREIVAAGAQRRRGPEIDHQRARLLAVILQVASHHLVGGARADRGGGARRDGARIDRGEVAAGRQHVGAAARSARRPVPAPRGVRRARRARRRARSQPKRAPPSPRRSPRRAGASSPRPATRPKTCRPSRMLSSLMSQSWASSLAMAWRLGSPFTRPQSAASPLVQARSTISSSR